MGFWQRLREVWNEDRELVPARKLDLLTGFNVRELGGYELADSGTPDDAGTTQYRRFLRSGSLDTLSAQDQRRLYDYGVRAVLDLRGHAELDAARDRLARMSEVRFKHVPLFDIDISDPKLDIHTDRGGYLTQGYLTMLGNRDAIRQIFSFFSEAQAHECVLFHCAAGMDRTGITAMLLLGLSGASTKCIVADYCYSFGSVDEVDNYVYRQGRELRPELMLRYDAISVVVEVLLERYGSFESYLLQCGLTQGELSRVRTHLCG